MESNSPMVVASFHLVHYHRLTPAPPKRLGQTEVGVPRRSRPRGPCHRHAGMQT